MPVMAPAFSAVVGNGLQVHTPFGERRKIIDRCVANGTIKTSLPVATGVYVPDAQSALKGCGATCGIRLVGQVNMPQQAQNLPELVVRMGVVLLHLQRTNARKTPKDEQPSISVADRIKAIEQRAGLRNRGVAAGS